MFNNPVMEEDEEEEDLSPGLTTGSTDISEDSFNNVASPAPNEPVYPTLPKSAAPDDDLHLVDPANFTLHSMPSVLSFDPNSNAEKHSRNKLRKKRGDDYDSDGGYISESRKSSIKNKAKGAKASALDEKIRKSEENRDRKQRDKQEKERAKAEKERKKKESKAAKKNKPLEDPGYDTDGANHSEVSISKSGFRSKSKPKSKSKSTDESALGYDTDDGSLKPKKSRSFFRLTSRAKAEARPHMQDSSVIPPVPVLPALQLPIADKFATTLPPSVVPPPLPLSGNLSSSTSAATFSPPISASSAPSSALGTSSASKKSFEDVPEESGKSPKRKGLQFGRRRGNSTESESSSGHSGNHATPASAGTTNKANISLPFMLAPSSSLSQRARERTPHPLTISPPVLKTTTNSSSISADSPFVMVTPLPGNGEMSKQHEESGSRSSIVSSFDFIVPSPSVLAHYDLPPPSPPPSGPLPLPPHFLGRKESPSPSRYPTSSSRPPQPTPLSISISAPDVTAGANVDASINHVRGRQAPFPMRRQGSALGSALDGQLRVRRNRDLFVIASPMGGQKPGALQSTDGHNWNPEAQEPDEEDNEQLRDVLDRFIDEDEDEKLQGQAVPTRHSYQDLKKSRRVFVDDSTGEGDVEEEDYYNDENDDDRSRYPDEDRTAGRSTMYMLENGSGVEDSRFSRYSEASRMSILDGEESENVRARFVRRVEAMMDNGSGRERGRTREPPVPKLPEGLAGRGRF